MDEKQEKRLQEIILPELERGRPGWDMPHTLGVVAYAKKLISHHHKLDPVVLITAAYAHDWGYADLFKGGDPQLGDIQKNKKLHMQLGAEKVANLLENDPVFVDISADQRVRIVHLVSVHDKLDQLRDEDELVLMEADTLGQLDTDYIKPTFDYESNLRFIENTKVGRISKFITPYAKEIVPYLIEKRMALYK